jgi:starch phosphorylase
MKFMLNGAVTLGTLDGANIEIVKEAGAGNNYIFGARIEDIERIIAGYDPKDVYMKNEKIRRTLHSLIDGTLDDGGSGAFRNIYDSLLEGDEFQQADRYFVLHDLPDYVCAKLEVNRLFKNKREFARKCFINMCSAGRFSSDRTVAEYARLIWRVKSI